MISAVAPPSDVLFARRSPRALTHPTVVLTSVLVVGCFFWVPVAVYYSLRKAKTKRRRILVLIAVVAVFAVPMCSCQLVKRLCIWDSWLEYFAVEVRGPKPPKRQAIFALTPHGVFPFPLGLAAVGRLNSAVFNNLRPIVASATRLFPVIGHLVKLIDCVDASAPSVHDALEKGRSLGLHPGGIAEMFCTSSLNEEYAKLKDHKGFIRMAIAHQLPVVPVYIFGSSHLFQRLHLPAVVEKLSRLLQASLIFFWGRFGLPIPLHIPLLFAMGQAIEPPPLTSGAGPTADQIETMHKKFCSALIELFDRYKTSYGWAHKELRIV